MIEDVPRPLVAAWVLLLGAVVGSFLNVVIARVPHGRSVVTPRSACPRCGAPIAWYDNVPVVSWILLRARCRACAAPIPVRYPLVEVLGAAAALAAAARHGLGLGAAAELAFVAILLALAFIDLDTWLLPHALTWPLIATGLLASAAGVSAAGGLAPAALGAGAGFAAFALVAVVGQAVFKREALGWGDVWLLAGIGAWLGAGALVPVVLLASLQGSVFGVALLLLGRSQPGPQEAPPGAPPASAARAAEEARASVPPSESASPTRLPTPQGGGEGIPHGPEAAVTSEEDWVPPRNAVPFGPFLALAALEWLYLGALLRALVPALEVFG